MKTSELIGPALDWAVATCEGYKNLRVNPHRFAQFLIMDVPRNKYGPAQLSELCYSTGWELGGPIIERERIQFRSEQHTQYRAFMGQFGSEGVGPTHLIAAMRCYVFSKLGDEIEIPEELG